MASDRRITLTGLFSLFHSAERSGLPYIKEIPDPFYPSLLWKVKINSRKGVRIYPLFKGIQPTAFHWGVWHDGGSTEYHGPNNTFQVKKQDIKEVVNGVEIMVVSVNFVFALDQPEVIHQRSQDLVPELDQDEAGNIVLPNTNQGHLQEDEFW